MGLVAVAALAAATCALGLKRVGVAGTLFLLRLETVDFGAAPVEGRFAVEAGVLMGAPPPPLPLCRRVSPSCPNTSSSARKSSPSSVLRIDGNRQNAAHGVGEELECSRRINHVKGGGRMELNVLLD